MGGDAGFLFPNNHPNPVLTRKPGWTPPSKIVNVTGGGNFILYRFDHKDALDSPGPVALQITPPGGEAYTLAYRIVDVPGAPEGAILLWEYQGFRSRLLDGRPGSALGIADAPLPVGASFTEPTGQVRVTITGKGGSGVEQFLKVSVEVNPESSPGVEMSIPPVVPAFARTPFAVNSAGWTWHSDVVGISAASARDGEAVIVGERGLPTGGNEIAIGRAETRHPFSNFELYAINTGTVVNALYSTGATLVAAFDGGVSFTSRPFGWVTRGIPIDIYAIAGEGTTAEPFIVVGESVPGTGAVARSENGGNSWSVLPLPANVPTLRGVARGGGVFVAVGDDGAAYSSADGITWLAVTTGTTSTLHAIAYDDGIWVAAGDENRILTSPNGGTWTERFDLPGTQLSLRAISFSDGIWFSSGAGSGVGISSDGGVTWTPTFLPDQTGGVVQLDALAAADGAVFAAGSGLATCASTGTGVAWAPVSSWETATTATAATFHGGRLFVATTAGDILA